VTAKINDGLTTSQRHYRREKLIQPKANAERVSAWRAANRQQYNANMRASYARHRAARLAAKKLAFAEFKANGYSDAYRLRDRLRKARRRAASNAGAPLTKEQWAHICAEHGNACAYCHTTPAVLEQDHVIAISKGGAHTASNVVPACKSCNSAKGDMPVAEFLARRA
jgi:5-methylcytosine-specific restriction endonuclease McrA